MSDSIGFLLSDSARLLRRRFDQYARTLGITRAQWQVLFALSRMEGIKQGGLAEHLEVEAITVCRMLDRLQEADLVERRADPTDRRAWKLYLTDKARPLLDSMMLLGNRVLDEALAGVDDASRDAFVDTLGRIRLNLTTRTVDEGALKAGAGHDA